MTKPEDWAIYCPIDPDKKLHVTAWKTSFPHFKWCLMENPFCSIKEESSQITEISQRQSQNTSRPQMQQEDPDVIIINSNPLPAVASGFSKKMITQPSKRLKLIDTKNKVSIARSGLATRTKKDLNVSSDFPILLEIIVREVEYDTYNDEIFKQK